MTAPKKYSAVKKVSLAGLYEGYDESCFAYVVPANFKVRFESVKLEDPEVKEDERERFQSEMIRNHFVSGVIKQFDGTDFTESKLTADIAIELPDVSNKLAMYVLGYDFDPKELMKAQSNGAEQSSENANSETPSSTESSPESPTPPSSN